MSLKLGIFIGFILLAAGAIIAAMQVANAPAPATSQVTQTITYGELNQ